MLEESYGIKRITELDSRWTKECVIAVNGASELMGQLLEELIKSAQAGNEVCYVVHQPEGMGGLYSLVGIEVTGFAQLSFSESEVKVTGFTVARVQE